MKTKHPRKKLSARKQTSQKVSSIAAKGLRTGKLTPKETRMVSASALAQDEKRGR